MTDRRKTAMKIKRERQVKRQKIMLAAGAIIIVAAVFIYIAGTDKRQEETNVNDVLVTNSYNMNTEGVAPKISETREERVERVRKEAMEDGYPEDVIELLAKNPETVRFVENYGEQKNRVPALEIAEFKKGEIPQLLQWDARWGYAPYGTGIIAVCGCGPTCLSMVVSGLTEDKTLTPARMAEYGTNHGYITEENDTRWVFMSEAAKEWGITCKEEILSAGELKKELLAGHPVICSVGPGDFTQIGHFIVLAGYKDGEIIVHDPFSQQNSDKRWKYEKFKDQIKSMWIYSMD